MQFLIQPDWTSEIDQVFRIQITDAPEILTIVTTPTLSSLPLAYNGTEISLPMCGSGVDFESTDQKMIWTVTNDFSMHDFVDSAGGVTSYRRVSVTGSVWFNGTSTEVTGGLGVVEVYHRR